MTNETEKTFHAARDLFLAAETEDNARAYFWSSIEMLKEGQLDEDTLEYIAWDTGAAMCGYVKSIVETLPRKGNTIGQDRESYTDEQDRESYSA